MITKSGREKPMFVALKLKTGFSRSLFFAQRRDIAMKFIFGLNINVEIMNKSNV